MPDPNPINPIKLRHESDRALHFSTYRLRNSEVDLNLLACLRWGGYHDPDQGGRLYWINEVVTDLTEDGLWLMRANKMDASSISQRPAPVPSGNPLWVFEAATGLPTWTTLTNPGLYMTGQRYIFDGVGKVKGYRFYVPDASGNVQYELWSVINQADATQLIGGFIPTQVGWVEIPSRALVYGESVIDLVLVADPVTQPTVWSANWQTKNDNTASPGSGECIFRNNQTQLRIHYTDNDSIDREAALKLVEVGGTVSFAGLTWTITSKSEEADHIRFDITPNQGRPTEDTYSIQFEYGSVFPVSYVEEIDYWAAAGTIGGLETVQGFKGTNYFPAPTLNNNAYGVDLLLDDYVDNPDFDVMMVQ